MDRIEIERLIDEKLAVHVYEQHKQRNPHFKRPTREEVAVYAREKGLPLDVDRFMEFYESNGWRVGKNPMKDWQATARRAAKEWCQRIIPASQGGIGHTCRDCGRQRRETEMEYRQHWGWVCKGGCP